MSLALRPCTRAEARAAVQRWHRTHKPHVQQRLAIGLEDSGALVAILVLEDPKAAALRNGRTWEVTRRVVGPYAPHCAASMLLGAAWRAASGAGVRRLVSYIRHDEVGTCYRAAGWVPTAWVRPEEWDGKRKPGRWLPGLHIPSTETCARIRWEIGPDSASTRVKRSGDGSWRAA